MKELHALEVWEASKHAPPRTLCRTALYESREQAKEALLDVNTHTVFGFLYDVQFADDPPLSLEGVYDQPEDYAKAYFDGVQEVVDAVNSLFAWIKGEREEWIEQYWLEFGITAFRAYLGEDPFG